MILKNCLKLANQKSCIKEKPKILRKIGDLLTKGRKFELADQVSRRAMEYSYYIDNTEEELECYELLGKLNYEINEINEAKYFHEKVLHSICEPKESIVRTIVKKQIDSYLKTQTTIDDEAGQ